ncbi:MAG: Ig-like domain-containing protein [Tepidisphaeraceae bacterium]
MKAQGCNVILDDLGFPGEAYFTDSSVAIAAQNAVNAGVVYVTSAGNSGAATHYQGNYVQGLSAFAGGRLHQFGSAGQDTNNINISNGNTVTITLEWSDAWGASANNYDLYLYDGDTFALLDSSLTVQNGNDLPLEFIQYTNNTGTTVHGQIWVNRKTGAAARELEMFLFNSTAANTLTFNTQGDALFGQEAVPGVISVAAVSAASPSSVESFSSRGGSTIYTDFATQTKTVRNSLDGTATDGVQTKVGQLGYFSNPFYGTSAASPHAGAIAALVLQARPSLTPAQVAQIMADTATDISTVGYDINSGAGRCNALSAVYKAFTPAVPDLDATSDSGISNTDNTTNDNTPTFTGVAPIGSDVQLLIDGVPVTTASAALGNYAITAPGLSNGPHTATIRVAPTSGLGGAATSFASNGLAFTIDTIAPTVSVPMAFAYDVPSQRITFTFSEDVAGTFDASDLLISHPIDFGVVPNANKLVSMVGNAVTMTFPGYTNGVLPDGDYSAAFFGNAVTDLAGNALMTPPALPFFTLAGDANHDRKVNFDDLLLLASNYGKSGQTFSQGNFDYDPAGTVNFDDLLLLASNYGKTLSGAMAASFSSTPVAGAVNDAEPNSVSSDVLA